jgi:transcriptional regulator with XRE-family HTH domain
MDLDLVFVRNIKKWRKNAGLSQEKLAERCKSAHSYIRQIESGSRKPSFSFIEKIALALDIEPYQLFYDETAAEPGPQSAQMKTVRTELLDAVAREIHAAFDKLKT